MLKLSALEFFFRTIPESFLIVMIAYIFANKKISKQRFIGASLVLAIITYLVRLLPISFGINTIINMILFIVIGVFILKISINMSIFSIFVSVTSLYFCEWMNILIRTSIFKMNESNNSYSRFIYNLPSLIIFLIIVFAIYMIVNKFAGRFSDVFH